MQKLTLLFIGFLLSIATLNAQGWEEITKTVPTQTDAAGYNYGYTVSIDGNYAVVGAHGYNNSQGNAYVLYYNGTGWETIAQLTASDGKGFDWFGRAVSINGDNIIAGAYGDDDNGTNSGSVYVFTKPTEGWADMTETAKLTASDGAADDFFGLAISISGDNIVVGAYKDDDAGDKSGSAYVFTKPEGGWINMTETAKLTASDASTSASFGNSVSISGNSIVIGANQDGEHGTFSGSAYVFTKPETGWITATQTAKLSSSDIANFDSFGKAVSISGDNIVIGAYQDSENGSFSGSAYVFTKPVGGWVDGTQTAKLTASDGATNDSFGGAVSISGDSIVIGTGYDDGNTGAAYVFVKPVTGWADMTEIAKLTASDKASDDYYGWDVGISGDNIVVGAYKDVVNGVKSGSAYFIKLLVPVPEINMKQGDTDIANGGTYDFGVIAATSQSDIITFTIKSEGFLDLTLSGGALIEISGANAENFTIDQTNTNANVAPGDSTTFTVIFAPTAAADYTAEISIANNDSDENPYTILLTGKGKLNQSITFDALEDKTFGDQPYAILATATSGLDVVFTSSDESVATCSGNIITITGAGTCTIYANQSGDDDYFAAAQVEQNLTVNKGTGINLNSALSIDVYPNPANELITITLPDGIKNATIELYGINGAKLMQFNDITGSVSANISHLAKGTYIFHLLSDNGSSLVRWVKE